MKRSPIAQPLHAFQPLFSVLDHPHTHVTCHLPTSKNVAFDLSICVRRSLSARTPNNGARTAHGAPTNPAGPFARGDALPPSARNPPLGTSPAPPRARCGREHPDLVTPPKIGPSHGTPLAPPPFHPHSLSMDTRTSQSGSGSNPRRLARISPLLSLLASDAWHLGGNPRVGRADSMRATSANP